MKNKKKKEKKSFLLSFFFVFLLRPLCCAHECFGPTCHQRQQPPPDVSTHYSSKKEKRKEKKSWGEKKKFCFRLTLFCRFALLVSIAVAATAAKNVVHVVDQKDVTTVGTRFAFAGPFPARTIAETVAFCHAIVVRDGSSESDDSASLGFGFDETAFRAHGWRLCTMFELATVSVLTVLPDGKYLTYSSADGDDITRFTVTAGRLVSVSEDSFTSSDAREVKDQIPVCCSASQFEHTGQGDSK